MGGNSSGGEAPGSRPTARLSGWLLGFCVLVATAATYHGVFGLGFVFDDAAYVTGNRELRLGLGAAGIRWAFTTLLMANWHPLTWLTHLADYRLFGANPAGHHGVNLAFHLGATALLFAFLARATGARWAAALVAALFGLHPLHVESVAWVSERKDVLSGALWMAALLVYLRYCARPGPARYAAVAGVFVLCLLAKPMTVTLPLVLLLLDYWPLGRVPAAVPAARAFGRLALEKLPLLALSAAAGAVAILAQRSAGTVYPLATLGLPARLANAVVAYGAYVAGALWPHRLAAYYPIPAGGHPAWKIAAGALLLVLMSVAAVRARRRVPALTAGWTWFVVTLLPVIGLLQVGMQARADRYVYLPVVGLFVGAAWAARQIARRAPRARAAAAAIALLLLGALGVRSERQVATWRDDLTLFRQVVAVSPDHWIPHYFLGLVLAGNGRLAEALAEYRACFGFTTEEVPVYLATADVLRRLDRRDEAAGYYRRALVLDPGNADALRGLQGVAGAARAPAP